MPGIAGFLKRHSSDNDQSTLDQMLECMLHEQFYVSGICRRPELGVSAGWVSREGFAAGCAWNDSKNVCLVLSGEVFGDSPGSDVICGQYGQETARRLIALYENYGLRFLEKLNGWFSGLLLDSSKGLGVLFNDRYGLGRIYFNQTPGAFFFSSEAKSLLKVLPQTKQLDERGIAEWLTCGCVLQNRTLFSNVSLLPPASAWVFSADGKLAKRNYFEPDSWESQPALTSSDYYESLKEVFPRVLKRYLAGNEAVAMSLTGGLDGRMIMAWSSREPGQLPCYTFNGPIRDCADVKIARKVAATCGQSHQTISVDDSLFANFPKLAERAIYVTDGAMDVTGAVELHVNRLARQIAPVRLTGNYGSEILRNYIAFRPRSLHGKLFSRDLLDHASDAARTYSEEVAGKKLSFIAFKQVPWHHFARFAIEQSQVTIRSPFLDNELVALAFQASSGGAANFEHPLRLIAEGNPKLGRIPTDRGITYPAGRVLNRVHRCVQEFFARAEYAYDYGMPNWLARVDRRLAAFQIERLFLGHQKFCHFRSWYRGPLAGYVQEVLLDPRARSRVYLNGSALEPMVRAHLQGNQNFTVEIHKLLSLELLQRLLLA